MTMVSFRPKRSHTTLFCACALLIFAIHELSSGSQVLRELSSFPDNNNNVVVSKTEFNLAQQQSFGFFTDITNDAWERMRHKAHSFVQYKYPTKPYTGFQNPLQWYLANLQPVFTCPHVQRVGGHDDGPKWTCDPHRLLQRQNCLVYSIGSEGKYEWEDGLIESIGRHCEIHVFDPGNYARPNDVQRNNIHYHPWGLGSTYDQKYQASISLNALQGQKPNLKTFPEILQELGHENRTIDIFKIDCEKCEWYNFKDWISADIRQVLIETHGVPSPYGANDWYDKPMNVAEFFDSFVDNHFAMFSKEVNIYGGGNCIEFSFIKLHPNFWSNSQMENAALPKDRNYTVDGPPRQPRQHQAVSSQQLRQAQGTRFQVKSKNKNGP